MAKYVVGNVSDLPDGARMIVEIEGRSVGVFNVGGEFYALLDRCPHAGAQLCSYGTVAGAASASSPDGVIRYEKSTAIKCPWHQWEFEISTGQSWYDPRNARVRKYEVDVVPGSPADFFESEDGLQKGPYVLEGFDVDVEGDTIVVDSSRRRRPKREAKDRPPDTVTR